MSSTSEATASAFLDITCFALRLAHDQWEIQCGPLPFADIRAMHQSRDSAAVLVEIDAAQVRRDITPEEDAILRSDFITKAKADGWTWDADKQCWRAPKNLREFE